MECLIPSQRERAAFFAETCERFVRFGEKEQDEAWKRRFFELLALHSWRLWLAVME